MLQSLRNYAGGVALFLLVVGALAGCGSSETTTIKKDLTEEEKQQIRELNEQRAAEWGTQGK